MEASLSDQETRFLLGELIKASSVDVTLLAGFIRANNIEQNWMLMQLPIGRNMHQCMSAVEKILPIYHPPPPNLPNLNRKSTSEASDQMFKRQTFMTPAEAGPAPRSIQPRPAPNGYTPSPPTISGPPTTITGKKRGRPSKADKEAQARASYPRPTEYAPITPAPLVPAPLGPQRESASSPGYEVVSGSADSKGKKRSKIYASERSPANSTYPLASPASLTETPRALPEAVEKMAQTDSPREPTRQLGNSRSPVLQQSMQHTSNPAQSEPQIHTLPPIQPAPRPLLEQYRGSEPPRVLDPIFPDRDRSRSSFDPITRSTPPAPSPLINRS